jgi:DNA-binding NarL/FixJ family response regulator
MTSAYRILLAEDHVMFRQLIKKSLVEISGVEVVGEVNDGRELLAAVESLTPDLITLDIEMPHISGLEAAREIKQTHPEIKILVLTMYKSKDHLVHAFEARVDGYLLKENAFEDLIEAIETVREGRMYISNLVTEQVHNSFAKKSWGRPADSESLSPREIEALKYLAEGKSNKEIAELLLLSESTVRTHLGHIKKKLFIKTNVELARYALSKGYTSLI